MGPQYYIRIRGTVRGPYTPEKLKELARRGQFSRHYHVSLDGEEWESASDYPELLPKARAVKIRKQPAGQPATEPTDDQALAAIEHQEESQEMRLADEVVDQPDGNWFYAHAGTEYGPCSFDELRAAASRGELQYNDVVWSEGMSDWTEAFSVPGLFAEGEFANLAAATRGHADNLSEDYEDPGASTPIAPMAIASLVSGLFGMTICFFVGSVLAIIFGHVALRQIAASEGLLGGRGLAIAGMVMGYALVGISLVVLLVMMIISIAGAILG